MITKAGLWHIKNTSWSIFSYPLRILKTSIKSHLNVLVSRVVKPSILNLSSYPTSDKQEINFVSLFLYPFHNIYVLFSEHSLYDIARPSVCLSSVMLVCPNQAVQILGNISMAFGTLAICWHPQKILPRSFQGNPSTGGVKHKRVAKYSDFGPIKGYISETVQDRK